MKSRNKSSFVYYMYALTGLEVLTGQWFETLKGLEGTAVDFMKVKDIVVVFGRLPAHDYSKDSVEAKIKDFNWLEQRIREHYHVQQVLMESRCSIIPLKFCTIFHTKQKIQGFVTTQRESVKNLLGSLRGKQEWCVKVFRNKELLKKNLYRFDPGIGSRVNAVANGSDGKSFLLRKKLLQDIEESTARLTSSRTTKLVADLKKISLESRQNETFAVPEKKDEEMIANIAFLLQHENVGLFKKIVDDFNHTHSEAGLFSRCSGPWLPYNFVAVSGVESHG